MIPAHIEHVFRALDRIERREPQQPMPGNPALVEGSPTTDDARTAGVVYPITCEPRFYDAASQLLESEPHLNTHDNADELGHVIQKWMDETRNNWEPR